MIIRIRPKLPLVIRSGQLCTVKGKNILFGVSNIISSILNINMTKSHACLVSLDFFKAYDRVFLGFLLKVMRKMNFGSNLISWIKMMLASSWRLYHILLRLVSRFARAI